MSNKNYLLIGRLISTFGDSIYSVAIMWYIFDITKDAFVTSITSAIIFTPGILSAFAGPIIDHFNRKKMMLIAQTSQFVIMIIIAIMFYLDLMPIAWLLFSLFLLGLIEIIEANSESSISPLVMHKDELIGYNSFVSTGSTIISVIAKLVTVWIVMKAGIESVYLLNAITFLIAVLFFYKVKYQHIDNGEFNTAVYKESIIDGWKYFVGNKLFLFTLPAMIANFTGSMTNAILPAFTFSRGGDYAYGYYLTASVVFALIGSLITPKFKDIDINKILMISPFISGVCMILTAVFSNLYVSVFVYGLVTLPIMILNISMFTYIQKMVDNKVLARVGTIMNALCMLAMPVGSLLGGVIAKQFGVDLPIYISGIGFMSLTVIFLYLQSKDGKIDVQKKTA
ncbi:MFS transporter [Macrococcoides caseolyticum]|uniref:MFS transporter n=1 Tax=Macrococcoides caseolyticum TaxID=69966 RepID=UPI001F15BBEC|nr:MFS transporter [Macrococcus caseolyticus]MCE4957320.1 MFS transporter [Macrococcus caseolyticus]